MIAWASFGAAIGLAFALGLHLEYDWVLFLLGAIPASFLLVTAIGSYIVYRSEDVLQVGFGLIGIATACLAGAWLAALT